MWMRRISVGHFTLAMGRRLDSVPTDRYFDKRLVAYIVLTTDDRQWGTFRSIVGRPYPWRIAALNWRNDAQSNHL